jgi:hypothetical protein
MYNYITDEDVHVHNGCSWNSWWFVAAISLLIGGVGVTAITILYTKNGETQYQVGIQLLLYTIHVNTPTFSGRLPLLKPYFQRFFLKRRGIFTN